MKNFVKKKEIAMWVGALGSLPDNILSEKIQEIIVTTCKSNAQKPPYYTLYVSRKEVVLVETSAVQINKYRYDCENMTAFLNEHQTDSSVEEHFAKKVFTIKNDIEKGIANVFEKPIKI